MNTTDLLVSEERLNLPSLLKSYQEFCLLRNSQSVRAFNKLKEIWECISTELWYKGYWNDYVKCGTIVLSCAKALDNISAQGQLLNELGWAYMEQEKFDKARQQFDESLQKFQLIKNPVGECQSLRYLGTLLLRQKHLESALKCYCQALEIVVIEQTKVHKDKALAAQEAELRNVLGNLYFKLQNFHASYDELHKSLTQYRELYSEWGSPYLYYQAAPLLNLGRLYFLQKDYENARKYYAECHQLCNEINRTDMKAGVLLRLAELARAEGNEEDAEQLAKEAEEVSGKEFPALRNQAIRFRYKVES
ncbi:tetratricopeptide repeat protein [Calothrix sp. NIES-2098]|uniref:tetratricopeptide repeat protein n=1 Tax=Calothrix sp. NIES-2098 TaxID=1954171 RepID=UPI000B5F0CAD|nr:tetratricopeptide TPR_2 [Calothrix sp. NIES-2098]